MCRNRWLSTHTTTVCATAGFVTAGWGASALREAPPLGRWKARVGELGEAFAGFGAGAAVAVVLLNAPVLGLLTLRSYLILRRLGYEVSLGPLLPMAILGNVAGALTPARSG